MTLSRQLIGPCGEKASGGGDLKVDIVELVNRLILFDTYIVDSRRFKELPHLLRIFGPDGLVALLSSKALRLYFDPVKIGEYGHAYVLDRREKGLLPLGSYKFGTIRLCDSQGSIDKGFQGSVDEALNFLDRVNGLDSYRCYRLKKAVQSSLLIPEVDIGLESLRELKLDLTRNHPAVRATLAKKLSDKLKTPIAKADFNMTIQRTDEDVFVAESDIIARFGLTEEDADYLVKHALLAVGDLDQRIQQMRAFSAISGFLPWEASIFDEKLAFLVESLLPEPQERRFRRVLEIRGFPELDRTDEPARLDAEKLLQIRETTECIEFRNWLSSIDSASDSEIKDRIASLQARMSALIHSKPGSHIRFLTTTGIGAIPVVGSGLSVALGILDHFLLDRVLPYSGPATFINAMYPSIFRTQDADRYGRSIHGNTEWLDTP